MSDYATPREASSVILVRPRAGAGLLETFMLRRHRKASFMGSAFVFPGGAADPGEDDPRVTAARELFEEAGVLLTDRPVAAEVRERWRAELHLGSRSFSDMLAEQEARVAVDDLAYYAHWITPSAEPKRFSARFYVAELPAGQTPSFDNRETVDEIWVSAEEALARAGELRLPPPQVRTFLDMQVAGVDSVASLRAEAARRAEHAHPIMPRMCPMPRGFALLLPWDPDYERRGTGDAMAMPADHPLAVGPSRFVLEDGTWNNIDAPASPPAA